MTSETPETPAVIQNPDPGFLDEAAAMDWAEPQVSEPQNVDLEQIDKIYKLPIRQRAGEVLSAAKDDFAESDHKVAAAGLGAAVVATQVAERTRWTFIVIPEVAVNILTEHQSPVKAALASMAIFAASTGGTGQILNYGLSIFPRAKEAFKEKFPIVVDTFRDALPGMNDRKVEVDNPTPEEQEIQEATELVAEQAPETPTKHEKSVKRVGAFLARNLRVAFTSTGIGATAFVATSSVEGDALPETTKLNLKVTAAGTVAVGAIVAGVGQTLMELPKHGYANIADYTHDIVSDSRFWWSAAILSMGSEFVSNYFKKRSLLKQAQAISQESSEAA